MSKKNPKESEFYKRFKFDKELFNTIFSGEYKTDKAILYLTTLIKATLPQQKQTQKKQTKQSSPALERIKEKYKKETPILKDPNHVSKKENYKKPSSIKSTQKPTFEKKESIINKSNQEINPASIPTKKTIIKTKKVSKKKVSEKVSIPKKKKIKTKSFINNVKFLISYLNPLKKSKPEKLKTTKLDDSIKRLKEREKKIQELFDKGKGKLS